MEQFYKGHRIEVSLSLDAGSWFVSLVIYYHEQASNILVTFSLKGKFTTYDEAVKAGLDAARRWVDTEKPVLDISTRTSGVTETTGTVKYLHPCFPNAKHEGMITSGKSESWKFLVSRVEDK